MARCSLTTSGASHLGVIDLPDGSSAAVAGRTYSFRPDPPRSSCAVTEDSARRRSSAAAIELSYGTRVRRTFPSEGAAGA